MRQATSAGTHSALTAIAFVALFATRAEAQREHPISETIRVPAGGFVTRPGGKFDLTVAVKIPRDEKVWHLYSITQKPGGPTRTTFTVAPAALFRIEGRITGTKPMVASDPNFGMLTETYADSAIFSIPVTGAATASGEQKLSIRMYYQTCNDRYCLPPNEDTLFASVRFEGGPVATVERAVASDTALPATPLLAGAGETSNNSNGTTSAPLPGNGSLPLFLWIAATMGALSLLTPCVFPMVPITISYFSRGESRGRGRAVRDAAVYAGGIILAFTSLGLGLAVLLGATGLNRFAANPWLNLAIAALFAGFALSLFGVVHFAVPGSFLTRIDRITRDSRFGRDGTTALMGATFALTSFTCTAPFVGTLLVSATQGSYTWPALGLLIFSAVFALPFLVLALVPEALARLPRSGEWMITMKWVLGFLELAAAMKFLSNADLVQGWNIFTRDVVLLSWIVIACAMMLYLFGVRIGRGAMTRGKQHPVAGLIAGLAAGWLAMGSAGHRLGELEPFLPPAGANASGVANANELSWILNDYAAATSLARKQHKFVLIDFTGYTCTNCRWMEANMFPRETVRAELDKFVRVRLFTDGRDPSNARQQAFEEQQFKTVALPLYAVVGPDGRTRATYLGMTRDETEFTRFLFDARGGTK
ncbi:MAG TPA: cytochrome c biogenesis protein CcdA [Gemmatimonadaceae bacterium]|nr:cytochrome c biogenesis protein CcdA [Gemmatimonadaceae bacterium]